MEKGKIIVIDGMDGTGKNTQSKLLFDKLKEKNDKVLLFSFPNYDNDSSYFVNKFLKEGYCRDINDPIIHSSFFAIDRAITFAKELKEKYEQGYIIILDRYIMSNILYHIHKYEDEKDKLEFCGKEYILENKIFDLPLATVNFVLYSDPSVNETLINKRCEDQHIEKDLNENKDFQFIVYNNLSTIKKYEERLTALFGYIVPICIHDENRIVWSPEYIGELIMNILEDEKFI